MKYQRITQNGSRGFWRFSDIFDFDLQLEEGGDASDKKKKVSNFFPNIPCSQSSIEATNKITKEEIERKPIEMTDLMEKFCSIWSENTIDEYKFYGFSFISCPFPYGGGSGNARLRSRDHSNAIWEGMSYLGRNEETNELEYDQRTDAIWKRNVSFTLYTKI